MGFVVEEVPLGKKIVGCWADGVVGVAEGFGAGAKEGIAASQLEGPLPNYFSNLHRVGAADTDAFFDKIQLGFFRFGEKGLFNRFYL